MEFNKVILRTVHQTQTIAQGALIEIAAEKIPFIVLIHKMMRF